MPSAPDHVAAGSPVSCSIWAETNETTRVRVSHTATVAGIRSISMW
jgi:hypothetical protein